VDVEQLQAELLNLGQHPVHRCLVGQRPGEHGLTSLELRVQTRNAPSKRPLGPQPIQSNRLTTNHPRPDKPGACSSDPHMDKREEPTMHTSSLRRTQRSEESAPS
jgi:hypothetical protein